MASTDLPDTIRDERQLDELLSEPTQAAVRSLEQIEGDIILLGVAGKMGPSLARMAKRASEAAGVQRRIIGVSRFSTPGSETQLQDYGIETIRGDLLDESFLSSLPDAPNVIHLAVQKFGSEANPSMTWATNVLLPALVCRRYPQSRIVSFSTGNVYPLVPITGDGSLETDPPDPVGEYGMTALGRERIFAYFSDRLGIAVSLVRLNYAVELRYGVLRDVAQQVFDGQEIDLSMGYANVIWQGDANAAALASLSDAATEPFVVNVAGPEKVSIREVAERIGSLFGKSPRLVGAEAATALLSNGSKGHERYGRPRVTLEQLVQWIADWIGRGGRSLGKPTHFEVRDGKF